VRQFLPAVSQHIACLAAAFVSPSRDHHHVHAASPELADAARAKFEVVADTLLVECRNRRDPIVRNRVRFEAGGPLLGRFLAAPVTGEGGGALRGVLLLLRDSEAPPFGEEEAREAQRQAHQLARLLSLPTDPLTGLLTRTSVEKIVQQRLVSLDERVVSSVLYGDIDQLHVVNDLLGFEAGDEVIASVAKALSSSLASRDAILSRLSGDRFTVFLPACSLADARTVAAQLRASIASASDQANQVVPLSMSFGAATLRAGERSFDHALAAAEVACKAAKDRGRNRVEAYLVSDSSIIRRRDDISIVARLRNALDEGRFQIFGQPIASLLKPEETLRYEMLLRIVDEKGRLVQPNHFMSSATRYQLLPVIDRCVVSRVLQQLQRARQRPGFRPLQASINLSGTTISELAFHDWLMGQLESSGVPGDWLTFELTETAAVNNLEQAKVLMKKLGALGCRFALDDFGTGVSSLAHLKDLQFSALKIDGAFVRDIMHNERSQSLVRVVSQLAGAMGMETIAEYVETPEVCMRLIELEVQFGQGYAIGRPRPLDGILDVDAALARAS
jgi:diguanylate cyclase (GGDEF)-like protein